jgi:hypothetical protein
MSRNDCDAVWASRSALILPSWQQFCDALQVTQKWPLMSFGLFPHLT